MGLPKATSVLVFGGEDASDDKSDKLHTGKRRNRATKSSEGSHCYCMSLVIGNVDEPLNILTLRSGMILPTTTMKSRKASSRKVKMQTPQIRATKRNAVQFSAA